MINYRFIQGVQKDRKMGSYLFKKNKKTNIKNIYKHFHIIENLKL